MCMNTRLGIFVLYSRRVLSTAITNNNINNGIHVAFVVVTHVTRTHAVHTYTTDRITRKIILIFPFEYFYIPRVRVCISKKNIPILYLIAF